MTRRMCVRIGNHYVLVHTSSFSHEAFIRQAFPVISGQSRLPLCHLVVHIHGGYGEPFIDYTVEVFRDSDNLVYERKDYRIEIRPGYREATVYVWDLFALKHALMNLYSSFLVSHGWGLLIHSSCVIQGGAAHVFAGPSGAGKSTVARLSQPRLLLSDEATIVHVESDGVRVYDSPFRSDGWPKTYQNGSYPLASINVLHQSGSVERTALSATEAMLRLMDKVFLWPEGHGDIQKTVHLVQMLVTRVPTFRLHFQNDSSFWETIV